MSQRTYPVECECGIVHRCPAGYAGSQFACKCGKTVEVPLLSQLRAAAGQAVLSPEVEIQTLMTQKALPVEHDCCLCGCETTETLMLMATCEMPEPPSAARQMARSGCALAPWFGFLGMVVALVKLQQEYKSDPTGQEVRVRFPLRMCATCASDVSSWDVIREAMKRTPVYRRLLRKYPVCQLGTVKTF